MHIFGTIKWVCWICSGDFSWYKYIYIIQSNPSILGILPFSDRGMDIFVDPPGSKCALQRCRPAELCFGLASGSGISGADEREPGRSPPRADWNMDQRPGWSKILSKIELEWTGDIIIYIIIGVLCFLGLFVTRCSMFCLDVSFAALKSRMIILSEPFAGRAQCGDLQQRDWDHSWTRDGNMWISGWWFQTFFIFHNKWDIFPLTNIFFRGAETTNQILLNNTHPRAKLNLWSVLRN